MYVGAKAACEHYGVTSQTLRKWVRNDSIAAMRTPGNKYRYWIDSSTQPNKSRAGNPEHEHAIITPAPRVAVTPTSDRVVVGYARVSTRKQADNGDLQRQVDAILSVCPEARVAAEVGSSLTFRRKRLLRVLEQVSLGRVSRLVCTHKDRISRFAIDPIVWLCEQNNTELVVLGDGDQADPHAGSPESELVQDLLAITHSFSSRLYGCRRNRLRGSAKHQPEHETEDHSVEERRPEAEC
jgi:putative resolvase